MTPEEIVERAAEVLVAHQRMDAGSCLCGWGELGRSHAKHVAQALAEAGLLPTEVEWSAEGEETDGQGDVRHFRDVHPDRDGAELAARAMDQLENVHVWAARRYVTPWRAVTP